MTATGGPHAGELPLADVTVRMAVFGRVFAERMDAPDPGRVGTAEELVALLRERVPRTTHPIADSLLFEAAAFIGEWLRERTTAAWVAEGPYEPHLQVTANTQAIIHFLPLVSLVRVASTAGYDGLSSLLDGVLADVADDPAPGPLATLRVQPHADQARVATWAQKNLGLTPDAASAALWRRCQSCATLVEDAVMLHDAEAPWEALAGSAAGLLARRTFRCRCGGAPGEVSRFLMMRGADDGSRLVDIFLAGTHTRIACWRVDPAGVVTPLDATSLAVPAVS